MPLIVFAQSTRTGEPTKRTLHDPPSGLNAEPACVWRSPHNRQVPVALSAGTSRLSLCLDKQHPPRFSRIMWHQWSEPCQEATSTSGIMYVRRGHRDGERQAECINEKMPFTTLDVLVSVKTADGGRLLDSSDADDASMIAALGCAFLPTRSRSATRRAVYTWCQLPFRWKRRKWEYTACQGGKLQGRERQGQPVRRTYKMA